jgi:intracellular septation protein
MTKKHLIANLCSEFLPIATFVIISETKGFRHGLKALVIMTLLALFISWFIEKRLPKFGLLASSTILFFAVLSIRLHNPFYIIIKDTLYYFGFGMALLIGSFTGHSPFKFLFGDFMAITERGWQILSLRWMVFFFLLTIGNEVARHMLVPVDWTLYKLIIMVITWIFGFYQLTLTQRERLPEANKWGVRVSQVAEKKIVESTLIP